MPRRKSCLSYCFSWKRLITHQRYTLWLISKTALMHGREVHRVHLDSLVSHMFEQDSIRCGVNPQRDLPITKLGQVHILQRHDGHRQHEFGNEVIGGSHQLHNDRKVYDNYMDKNDRSSWDVFKEDIDQAVWKRFLRLWETVESPEFGIVSPESWKPYTESLETFSSISKTVLGNVFQKSFPRIFGTLF